MPYKKSPTKKSSCIKMYDKKGKPSGLLMEGSAMHMEAGSPAKQIDERSGTSRAPQPFVDPGPDPSQGFTDDSRPYDLTSEGGGKGQYDEEAPSKKFFKSQDIVDRAVQTLEGIDAGKGTYTGYANPDQTVRNALLGTMRKDKLTTQQLKSLSKSDPVKGREYISRNLRNAQLGDARGEFNRSYNPFKKS
jgi:hypothetical protein